MGLNRVPPPPSPLGFLFLSHLAEREVYPSDDLMSPPSFFPFSFNGNPPFQYASDCTLHPYSRLDLLFEVFPSSLPHRLSMALILHPVREREHLPLWRKRLFRPGVSRLIRVPFLLWFLPPPSLPYVQPSPSLSLLSGDRAGARPGLSTTATAGR